MAAVETPVQGLHRSARPRRGCRWRVWLGRLLVAAAAIGGFASAARAQIGSDRYSSIVVEAATGSIISAVNPDELRHPASLTKMMTLYMVFEALRDRRIGLNQLVPVSAHASAMSPTKLGLMPGTRISVEEAILGLVTKSANDAAAALGEMLGGDEMRFAQMMTLRARALGMSRTVFRNASGLPDFEQVSTARDLALLGRRLVQDFPVEYRYFSVPQFRWRGRVIFNHDQLLERYPGTDGIKTGYVEASGFNLVTSTVRGNLRLVGVVMGASRAAERDLHMIALLDQAYEKLDIPVAPRVQARAGRHLPQRGCRPPRRQRRPPRRRCRRGPGGAGQPARTQQLARPGHRSDPVRRGGDLRHPGETQGCLHGDPPRHRTGRQSLIMPCNPDALGAMSVIHPPARRCRQ
jgi:D-alanyl-D-alanine carboxypeptidase